MCQSQTATRPPSRHNIAEQQPRNVGRQDLHRKQAVQFLQQKYDVFGIFKKLAPLQSHLQSATQ
jgi:hypothetical protein